MIKFLFIVLIFIHTNIFALEAKVAKKKFTIYTAEIRNINEKIKRSTYSDFLKIIQSHSELDIEIRYLPAIRGLEKFQKEKDTCYFPYARDVKNSALELIFSKPLGEVPLFAINKRGQALINKENMHKKIGAMKSIHKLSLNIAEPFDWYFVESDEQLFFMLDNGRVDFILESIPDIYLAIAGGKEEFDKKYQYDSKSKIKVVTDHFACHKSSKEGTNLIKLINQRIQ